MCDNMVTQYVPRGWDYRAIDLPCGSTSIHGDRLLCERCENDHAKQAQLRQIDENADADNAWLRSAGWGEI